MAGPIRCSPSAGSGVVHPWDDRGSLEDCRAGAKVPTLGVDVPSSASGTTPSASSTMRSPSSIWPPCPRSTCAQLRRQGPGWRIAFLGRGQRCRFARARRARGGASVVRTRAADRSHRGLSSVPGRLAAPRRWTLRRCLADRCRCYWRTAQRPNCSSSPCKAPRAGHAHHARTADERRRCVAARRRPRRRYRADRGDGRRVRCRRQHRWCPTLARAATSPNGTSTPTRPPLGTWSKPNCP